jgi:hypothetical protein
LFLAKFRISGPEISQGKKKFNEEEVEKEPVGLGVLTKYWTLSNKFT